MIDEVLMQFRARDLDDFQIDRMLAAAEKFAEANFTDDKVQNLLAEVKAVAEKKKHNEDILVIKNINDTEGLRKAVCNYCARVEKNPDAANDIKLFGLTEKMSEFAAQGVDILPAADVMSRYLATSDNEKNVRACAQNVISAYSVISNYELTPTEAQKMFRNLDELSEFQSRPKYELFLDCACCERDLKTAEVLLKHLSKSIDQSEFVVDSGRISDECRRIVLTHPEMARSCMDVVKKSLDKQSPSEYHYKANGEALRKAAVFYEAVNRLEGVSESDKVLARSGKKVVDKKIEQRNKPFLEGKRVILSPDKPPRVVSEEVFQ